MGGGLACLRYDRGRTVAAGVKTSGSKEVRSAGRKHPFRSSNANAQTGQCSTSAVEMSHMWLKKVVPIPLDKVYLEVNVNRTPSAALGVMCGPPGPNDVKARSRPEL